MREALLSQYPEYRAPSHWHDDIEFICVLSGGMKYNVNGEIVNLKKGEGIFVNSGQMHSGFSDNGLLFSGTAACIALLHCCQIRYREES